MRFRIYLFAACLFTPAHAEVVRLELTDRSDVLEYERLAGKAYFAVDSSLPMNRVIVDIDRAPKNSKGLVEFSADFYILRPRDPARRNGTLLFEPPNRGGKGMLAFFNRARSAMHPQNEAEFGDNFLLDRGFTLLWLGWQADLEKRTGVLRLDAPVATQSGKPITGMVRTDFVPDQPVNSFPIADRGHTPYPIVDEAGAILTVRDSHLGERRTIPRSEWNLTAGTRVTVPAGLEPGRIYEFVYTARDPYVGGLGLAGVRDMVSFLKHGGSAELPGVGRFERAIGFGISQSGMFFRTFLYFGFNRNENKRQVFDGIFSHVAGGRRVSLNRRFAQPSRTAGPYRAFFSGSDMFPFTDSESLDPVTNVSGGLLSRSLQARVEPKIFYTNTSYEYWGCAASLIHTSPDGSRDMPLPANVRVYMFSGGQHGPAAFPPSNQNAQYPVNPNDYRWSMRALLFAMQAWVTRGVEPPVSQYPRIATRELVPIDRVRFPKIPAVQLPYRSHESFRLNSQEPPTAGPPYGVRLPQVDVDGIDLGGIRLPEVAVPLATYTGWNRRAPASGASKELTNNVGSWIPFTKTQSERSVRNDPRTSIEERYATAEEYQREVAEAAKKLAAKRYLLAEDIPEILQRSRKMWDYIAQPAQVWPPKTDPPRSSLR